MTNAGRLQGGDAQPTESAESDWSDQIANAGDTPIGELVDGLHEVAAPPIAYTRLPRRAHTAFAEDFTCWGERRADIDGGWMRPRPTSPLINLALFCSRDLAVALVAGTR